MSSLRLFVVVAALLGICHAGCGGSSSAPEEGLLFTHTLRDNGGTRLPGISWYTAALGVETHPGSSSYPEVFEDFPLMPADEGTTFVVVESDDSEFQALVDLLRNGEDDRMRLRVYRDGNPALLGEMQESEFDFEVDRRGAPDLQNYLVTRFELHVVELRFEVPGNDPNGDGDWQERFVELRLEIHGMR